MTWRYDRTFRAYVGIASAGWRVYVDRVPGERGWIPWVNGRRLVACRTLKEAKAAVEEALTP